MDYLFLIIFAITPSIIWLLFFLKKDSHPEPKSMILKIFLWGMLSAIPAIFIEFIFLKIKELILISFWNFFIGIAFIEEFLKYIVVKYKVLKSSELDEPLDVMLYMIISALGFAALENFLIFLSSKTFLLNFDEYLL